MKDRFGIATLVGLGALAALLLGNAAISFRNVRQLNDDTRWIAHTQEVLDALEDLLGALRDVETGQRGYVIADDRAFLEPYRAGIDGYANKLRRVEALVADNPRQVARAASLTALIDARLAEAKQVVVAQEKGDHPAALALAASQDGKRTMDGIRATVRSMEDEEKELLRARERTGRQAYAAAVGSGLVAAIVGAAALAAFAALLDRHHRMRLRALAEIRQQRELLHATVASIGDGVIATDGAGRVTFLNAVAQQLTGWSQREAHGQPLTDVFNIVNETTRATVDNPALRALVEGRIVGLANHTILIAKDGVERPIDDSAAPIRDADNRVNGAVLVFRDITERRRTERASADREQAVRLLAAIVESSDDAIVSKTLDGTIRSWNAAAERLFCYPAADAIGRPITMLIPPERIAEEDRIIGRVKAGERVEHFDTVRRRADGADVHVALTVSPIKDRNGTIVGASKIARDISERRRAERMLREIEEREAFVRESSGIGFWYCDLPFDVLVWDERVKEHFWLPADATVSIETFFERIHPADREPTRRAIEASIADHTSYDAEYRTVDPVSGAEKRVRAIGRTFYAADGAPTRFDGVTLDISERQVAEDKVRDSEERYRTLVEQVKEHAIFGADLSGRATTWNEGVRRVLGFEENDFVGKDIVEAIFTPEDIVAGVAQRELETAAAAGSASDDRWMKRKDGTRFWAAGITTARRDRDGRLVGFTKVMRDMTAQKRMQDELRQVSADLSEANRRKDEFLATLAHELRNPLAPIRNGLRILRLRGAGGADDQPLAMMERQLGQMVRLVDDLLDVSRIDRDKIALHKRRAPLAEIIEHAVETSRPLIDASEHRLTVDLPTEPIYVDADVTRLAQVVSNLLNNAAKYTERGGTIELLLEAQHGDATIRVRDNGVGIPAPMLARVFDLFTQVDRSLEKSQGGLGIGLTLVKRLVEMHGGSVEARSEGHGLGSEFIVRLPTARPPVTSADEPRSQRAPVRRRIVVADDNVDSAESLSTLLILLGNEVGIAHDGLQALGAVELFRPELVFLDIGMPRMNGYEACRRIRAMPESASIFVVALTGWGQDDDRRRSAEAGFDHHLVKPVDPATLERLLAALPAPSEA